MLLLSKSLESKPILSLQHGGVVGSLGPALLNPNNLSIAGFFVHGPRWVSRDVMLLVQDIREINQQGVIIDSDEEIVETTELVRLEDLLKINYKLIGKPVITESKKRLGRVEEFVIETLGFRIQKIHTQQSMFRNFSQSSLKIDRSQIINLSDHKVTVKDADVKEPLAAPATA